MSLVVDYAGYTDVVFPPALSQGGVRLSIVKLSSGNYIDPKAKEHIITCEKHNFPYAVYHWVDPTRSIEDNVSIIVEGMSTVAPNAKFIALDFEQWWDKWGTWYDALKQKISWSAVGIVNPQILHKYLSEIYNALVKEFGHLYPVIVYSSEGFLKDYSPLSIDWLNANNIPIWIAAYWNKYNAAETVSWENLSYPKLEDVTLQFLKKENLVGWQFTGDRKIVPGLSARADINVFSDKFLSSVPLPKKYSVIGKGKLTGNLNFRTQPDIQASKLCTLPYGMMVDILSFEEKDWVLTNWGYAYAKYIDIDVVDIVPPSDCRPQTVEELVAFLEKEFSIKWC